MRLSWRPEDCYWARRASLGFFFFSSPLAIAPSHSVPLRALFASSTCTFYSSFVCASFWTHFHLHWAKLCVLIFDTHVDVVYIVEYTTVTTYCVVLLFILHWSWSASHQTQLSSTLLNYGWTKVQANCHKMNEINWIECNILFDVVRIISFPVERCVRSACFDEYFPAHVKAFMVPPENK